MRRISTRVSLIVQLFVVVATGALVDEDDDESDDDGDDDDDDDARKTTSLQSAQHGYANKTSDSNLLCISNAGPCLHRLHCVRHR